jgi:hypothetical protein
MGNGKRRAVPCVFCQERTFVTFTCTQLVNRALRIQKTALCPQHLAALLVAGARGRVHGPSGVRWWLGMRYGCWPAQAAR